MKGEFVDINAVGARVEVTAQENGEARIEITKGFELHSESEWRKLVKEVGKMIERVSS